MADVAKNRDAQARTITSRTRDVPSLFELLLSSWIFLPSYDRICDATATGNSCFLVFVRDKKILLLKKKLFFDSDADIVLLRLYYVRDMDFYELEYSDEIWSLKFDA